VAKTRYQLWTSDMVIGAGIAIIGFVATLVHLDFLVVRWNVELPPMVTHLWPLLLIGAGILLLIEHDEHRATHHQRYLRSGERQ
jgi:hypothetical protein